MDSAKEVVLRSLRVLLAEWKRYFESYEKLLLPKKSPTDYDTLRNNIQRLDKLIKDIESGK